MANASASTTPAAKAVRALSRNVPLSPQKGRLVADQIRGKMIGAAVEILQFSRKKAASLIIKTLNSAIANAEENASADIDALRITRIEVSDGIVMKRAQFGARGRVSRISKRRSHILIELAETAPDGGKRGGKRGGKNRGNRSRKTGGAQ